MILEHWGWQYGKQRGRDLSHAWHALATASPDLDVPHLSPVPPYRLHAGPGLILTGGASCHLDDAFGIPAHLPGVERAHSHRHLHGCSRHLAGLKVTLGSWGHTPGNSGNALEGTGKHVRKVSKLGAAAEGSPKARIRRQGAPPQQLPLAACWCPSPVSCPGHCCGRLTISTQSHLRPSDQQLSEHQEHTVASTSLGCDRHSSLTPGWGSESGVGVAHMHRLSLH